MSSIEAFLRHSTGLPSTSGEPLPAPPAGRVAVLTCMDARIDPAALLGLAPGQAHVLRNAGGVMSEDMIRSLALSQAALGTREIMLIQHTRCGLHAPDEEPLRQAVGEAAGAVPPFPLLSFPDLDASVRRSMQLLAETPYLVHRDAVRGFVYELESGRLREVEA